MLFDDGFSFVLGALLFYQYEIVYLIDSVSEDGISLLFCNHNLNIVIECFSFIIYESDSFGIKSIVPLCIDLMCFIKLPFSINLKSYFGQRKMHLDALI